VLEAFSLIQKGDPLALPGWQWKFDSSGIMFFHILLGLRQRCLRYEAFAFVLAFCAKKAVEKAASPNTVHLGECSTA
jgi:hypothetical protein